MSQHYTFSFSTDLDIDISNDEIAVIDYMFSSGGVVPNPLPQHRYFSASLFKYPYGLQYKDFPKALYSAELWLEKNSSGIIARRFVSLHLPGQNLEGVYEDILPFVSWLSTLSAKSGFVGYFNEEGVEDFNPTLLFIYKKALYIGDAENAYSFSNGDSICFKSIS